MGEEIRMKAGTATAKEVPFKGCPQPQVEWAFNGGKLPDPKRIKTQTIVNMTSITMAKVVRTDSGDYTAKLANETGEATYTLKVTVIGKTFCDKVNSVNLHCKTVQHVFAKQ